MEKTWTEISLDCKRVLLAFLMIPIPPGIVLIIKNSAWDLAILGRYYM